MFKELKKECFKKIRKELCILLICGAVLCLFNLGKFFWLLSDYQDFASLSPDEIRPQLVNIDFQENYGCFMWSGTPKNTGQKNLYSLIPEIGNYKSRAQNIIVHHYYYIIRSKNTEGTSNGQKYMAIKVPAGYYKKINTGKTFAPKYNSAIPLSGQIKRLNSDEKTFLRIFLHDAGFKDSEIEEMTIPYCIRVFNPAAERQRCLILAFIGLIMIAWVAFRIFLVASGWYFKKFLKDIASNDGDESVEEDFNEAESFSDENMFKVGRLFTYYMTDMKPRAIPNSQIIWAYANTAIRQYHDIYGFKKTRIVYNVAIHAHGYVGAVNIPVNSDVAAEMIAKKLGDSFPWIVAEYSDRLEILFYRDPSRFLDMKYNKYAADSAPAASNDQES